ncbi:MAG TPA: chloramphenicol acetyltransferase [Anaerolineales bacterium]|nr:chloramphenicol acetyltransferase [Anaerolineales bacterium]
MRHIDMQTWSRRNHFKLFSSFDHPHFSMCVNMDVTAFYPFVKRNGYSLTVSMVYLIARTSNAIPEFRQRIRGDQVVEHEIVNPGFSILIDEDRFSFCDVEYAEDFSEFAKRAAKKIADVKEHLHIENDPEKDDVLYMSPIPWVSFTSFNHPMQLHPADSIPRFAWGKFFQESDTLKMPLNVQGHHAVMDGIHMGRFYETVQDYLHHPEVVLGAV